MFIGYKTSILFVLYIFVDMNFGDEMGFYYQKPNHAITPERKRRRRKLNNVTVH